MTRTTPSCLVCGSYHDYAVPKKKEHGVASGRPALNFTILVMNTREKSMAGILLYTDMITTCRKFDHTGVGDQARVCSMSVCCSSMACALLFECRLLVGDCHPLRRKSKKRERYESPSNMQTKYGRIPQGAYVLMKHKCTEKSEKSDGFRPLFVNGSYDLRRVCEAKGTIAYLQLAVEPQAVQSVLWVRFEERTTHESFCCMPVLIRETQRFAVTFLDTLSTPGTRVADLRQTTVTCVDKARARFQFKHGRKFLRKVDVLTVYTALVEATDEVTPLSPPTVDRFSRMGALCVRTMPKYEVEAHLHLHVNGLRCYHVCTPHGLPAEVQRRLESECKRQSVGGIDRWVGTLRPSLSRF